jgi:hypothetical protein
MGFDYLGAFLDIEITGCIATSLDTNKPVIPIVRRKCPTWFISIRH